MNDLQNLLNEIENQSNSGLDDILQAVGLNANDYNFQFPFNVNNLINDAINIGNAGMNITRKHRVFLLDDCCIKAEEDYQKIQDYLNMGDEEDLENEIAQMLASIVITRGLPIELIEELDQEYGIPILGVTVNILSKLEESVVSWISNSITDQGTVSYNFDRNMKREFQFCEQHGYSAEIQNNKYIGNQVFNILIFHEITVESTETIFNDNGLGDIYVFVSDTWHGGESWGWEIIEIIPGTTKVNYISNNSLVGDHVDELGKYSNNFKDIEWSLGIANRIRWKWVDQDPGFVGLEVKDWSPFQIGAISSINAPFAFPEVESYRDTVRIAQRDYLYNPCGN